MARIHVEEGVDPGFSLGGGGKNKYRRARMTSATPEVPYTAGVQGPLKSPVSSPGSFMLSRSI